MKPERPRVPKASLSEPDGWQDDLLSRFFAYNNANTYGVFRTYKTHWKLFSDIHEALDEFLSNLDAVDEVPHPTLDLLLMRAQAAYLGALQLVVSRRPVEAYPLLRNALENALYAFYFLNHHDSADTWFNRPQGDDAARAASRRASHIGPMLRYLQKSHGQLGARASELYNRTIDLGAHPNQEGFTSALRLNGEGKMFSDVAGTMGAGFEVSLTQVAAVGLVVLEIACLVFPMNASAMNLPQQVEALKERQVALESEFLMWDL